jgi:hypothetical protein
VDLPVGDVPLEHRPEQAVLARSPVESRDHIANPLLGDPLRVGMRGADPFRRRQAIRSVRG